MAPSTFAIQRVAAFVAAHVEPGASILDVGAGRGLVTAELGRRGFHVTAIDVSERREVALAELYGRDGSHRATVLVPEG